MYLLSLMLTGHLYVSVCVCLLVYLSLSVSLFLSVWLSLILCISLSALLCVTASVSLVITSVYMGESWVEVCVATTHDFGMGVLQVVGSP